MRRMTSHATVFKTIPMILSAIPIWLIHGGTYSMLLFSADIFSMIDDCDYVVI